MPTTIEYTRNFSKQLIAVLLITYAMCFTLPFAAVADETAANGYVDTSIMHPISFSYTDIDAGTYFTTAASDSLVGTVVTLYGGKIECGSCHNIHGTNTNASALRDADANTLCNECKKEMNK